MAAWIPTKESVEAMVRYHKEHTSVGYDGIYVDDFQSTFYGPWASYVEEIRVAPEHMERCTASRPAVLLVALQNGANC